ncbi:MAG: hypothetical protein Q9P01_14085 [Anaerolineae bacterium]|nr:hypothetical protein [Anaerolineae bacterium]
MRDELFDDDDDEFGDGEFGFDIDDGEMPIGQIIGDGDDFDDFDETGASGDGRILGMNGGERAFLSVMVFLNVVVLGIGALMATGRLTF